MLLQNSYSFVQEQCRVNDGAKVAIVGDSAAAAADLIVVSDERLCKWQIINCDISKLERNCSTNNTISAGVRHLVHHLLTTMHTCVEWFGIVAVH